MSTVQAALPAFLCLFVPFCIESPTWLIQQGRMEDAAAWKTRPLNCAPFDRKEASD